MRTFLAELLVSLILEIERSHLQSVIALPQSIELLLEANVALRHSDDEFKLEAQPQLTSAHDNRLRFSVRGDRRSLLA